MKAFQTLPWYRGLRVGLHREDSGRRLHGHIREREREKEKAPWYSSRPSLWGPVVPHGAECWQLCARLNKYSLRLCQVVRWMSRNSSGTFRSIDSLAAEITVQMTRKASHLLIILRKRPSHLHGLSMQLSHRPMTLWSDSGNSGGWGDSEVFCCLNIVTGIFARGPGSPCVQQGVWKMSSDLAHQVGFWAVKVS